MSYLWRNRRFVQLLLGSTVSGLGSKVTATAIPLTAAITLEATPAQMAILVIAGQLPDVLFGLLAGSWIDRGRHRQFLVGADLGQAALLATIPASALLGTLSFPLLVTVAFACATLSIFKAVASVAVLPSVVRQDQLIEANAALTMSGSVVSLAGPGFAGMLIQLVSAPKAILFDAISFVASAFTVRQVGNRERRPATQSLARDVMDGLRELVRTPMLRALTLSSAVFAIGLAVNATILLLFLTRQLGWSAGLIGVYLAAGGAGTLAGSFLARPVSRCLGVGVAIIGGTAVEAVAAFAIPLAVLLPQPIPVLFAAHVANGVGFAIYSANHVSLRQRIVAPQLLGRITAGRRFVTFVFAPLGAVLGAWIGDRFGLTVALVAAALFLTLGTLVMWASPVRSAGLPIDVSRTLE